MSADTETELNRLQHLSLVQRINNLLNQYLQVSDVDLAEFIAQLALDSTSFQDFSNKLDENDAGDWDKGLQRSIYQAAAVVTNSRSKPTSTSQTNGSNRTNANQNLSNLNDNSEVATKYFGLCLPDSDQVLSVEDDESDRLRREQFRRAQAQREQQEAQQQQRANQQQQRDTTQQSASNINVGQNIIATVFNQDRQPVIGHIYDATIRKMTSFGAFAELNTLNPPVQGLIHISQVSKDHIANVSDVLRQNQQVKVKIITIKESKIGLSMKHIDQSSGQDLEADNTKQQNNSSATNNTKSQLLSALKDTNMSGANAVASRSNINNQVVDDEDLKPRRKRAASLDAWELNQLAASGAIAIGDNEELDVERVGYIDNENDDDGEEIDIELNEFEPNFLQGQTRLAETMGDSIVPLVKNPDGPLQRAALTQGALAKERRELRDQEFEAQQDLLPTQLNQVWEDPLAKSHEKHLASELKHIGQSKINTIPEWKQDAQGKNVSYGKITNQTIEEQRQGLPVYELKDQFIQAFKDNQILVVIGSTGSGKSTQLPQYLYESRLLNGRCIAICQPRRVAATSLAKRVCDEVGCVLGTTVGYSIRFEDVTSKETQIKYMTDGILMREILLDPSLSKYSVIMLDEAHERTINTDVLFCLLKKTCKQRPSLRLIVTSATLDAEKFSTYFNQCPIFSIPGRLYPVTIFYSKQPEIDYLDACLITTMQIHLSQPPGDILMFLTGKEEIDSACSLLYERIKSLGSNVPQLLILPVYSALPSELQSQIFEPAPQGSRKCIIATNIAEASLTIDGIVYCVDSGMVKLKTYNPRLAMDSLVVTPISQASANQRAGRSGRQRDGFCYRLYTEQAMKTEMLPMTIPEIQRTNLSSTVLQLKAMGINDLLHFDFMDAPPVQSLIQALKSLYDLGALDDDGLLTKAGRRMAEFPLEPQISKVLIASSDMGCAEEILTIVAMLSIDSPFHRPKDKQAQADAKRAKFFQPEGDHLTLLTVYNDWKRAGFSNEFCFKNFVQSRQLRKAQEVRKQLLFIMERHKLPIESCGRNFKMTVRAICSGYFDRAAKKDKDGCYKTLTDSQEAFIHPSSALFNRQPQYLIYHQLVLTSKEYMRECLQIDPKWLAELAPNFYKNQNQKFGEISRRKQREKIEPIFNKHEVPNSWRLSKRNKL